MPARWCPSVAAARLSHVFETHRTVRMLGLSLLVSIAAASTSRAEFPALTRMSETADYGIGHADLVARKQLALTASLGVAAGLQGRPLSVGSTQGVGRASAERLFGRLSVFAGGLWDKQRHLDPAEFPLRLIEMALVEIGRAHV